MEGYKNHLKLVLYSKSLRTATVQLKQHLQRRSENRACCPRKGDVGYLCSLLAHTLLELSLVFPYLPSVLWGSPTINLTFVVVWGGLCILLNFFFCRIHSDEVSSPAYLISSLHSNAFINKTLVKDDKMTHCLRTLFALAEDVGSIFGTHMVGYNLL